MKQTEGEIKVVNWHRPLGPDELGRRYRRLRDLRHLEFHDPAEELWDESLENGDEEREDCDEYWDPRSPFEYADWQLTLIDQRLRDEEASPLLWEVLGKTLPDRVPPRWPETISPAPAQTAHLEPVDVFASRLSAFRREWLEAGRVAPGEWFVLQHVARVLDDLSGPDARGPAGALRLLAVLRPFWIRPLESWSPPDGSTRDGMLRSLVDHLFVRYPIPAFLYQNWLVLEGLPRWKWVCWSLTLGRGIGLHRVASYFEWNVPRRLEHFLRLASGHLSPVDAVMWAEIQRLGGQSPDFQRIRRHPGYVLDITAGPYCNIECDANEVDWHHPPRFRPAGHDSEFWQGAVRWLGRYRAELTDPQAAEILDWALHRFLEEERARHWGDEGRGFQWTGRSPAGLLEQIEEARQLEQRRRAQEAGARHALTWAPRGWDWSFVDPAGETWELRELHSVLDLNQESEAMHHCVANYSYQCALGRSSIFSLRRGGCRVLTVEVEPGFRRIVQARGVRNRPASAEENAVLSNWHEHVLARSGATDLPDAEGVHEDGVRPGPRWSGGMGR